MRSKLLLFKQFWPQEKNAPGLNNSCNRKFYIFWKIMGHAQQECWKRIKENKPCIDMNGCPFWPKLYATLDNTNSMQTANDPNDGQFGFSLKSIMTSLMNAPSVIPQLTLNLCAVSIATCNKYLNQMTPFYGDKIRHRVTARAGG
jgi:hypothetical protein